MKKLLYNECIFVMWVSCLAINKTNKYFANTWDHHWHIWIDSTQFATEYLWLDSSLPKNMSIMTERVRNIGFDPSLPKTWIWTSWLRGRKFSSPRMKPFSKYVTDPLVRGSESFEPSKSWGNKASNRQKNLKKCSSLRPSLNYPVTFKTMVGGSWFRLFFHRRVFTKDVKILILKHRYFVF